jgi:hypothetical protein
MRASVAFKAVVIGAAIAAPVLGWQCIVLDGVARTDALAVGRLQQELRSAAFTHDRDLQRLAQDEAVIENMSANGKARDATVNALAAELHRLQTAQPKPAKVP